MVLDGNNADDRGDYRPGRQAAREHGVRSPLDEADLTRTRFAGWRESWACPHGTNLPRRVCRPACRITRPSTRATLGQIERAEDALHKLGFRVYRVRHHEDLARIEFGPDDLTRALEPEWRTAWCMRCGRQATHT